jgi:hypothetical protein
MRNEDEKEDLKKKTKNNANIDPRKVKELP